MLSREYILELFEKLNNKLKEDDEKGELLVVGGAVMCVAYQSRHSTKDVDAVFAPAAIIREKVREIADEESIASDWINDGAKGYFTETSILKLEMAKYSNLTIWMPEPEYILAMKCLSSRVDSHDGEDISFLLNKLGISDLETILKIVEKYYPQKVVLPRTVYFLEEILEKQKS